MTQAITAKFYGNCQVYNKDNQLMFCCDEKRINWYLKRNLAEKLSPNSIRLLFQTKGNGHVGEDYFLNNKENICVVCCGAEDLTRHHVVPLCYRKHFPDIYKNRFCYDIFLLCIKCHNKYEKVALNLKKEISKEYSFQEGGPTENETEIRELKKIEALISLLSNENKIPLDRKQILEKTIEDYLIKMNLNREELLLNCKRNRCRYERKKDSCAITFGEYVVNHLTDIPSFIKRWREHFVKEMNPQHLPKGYDVNKYVERPSSLKV